jgi:hypothetical protein
VFGFDAPRRGSCRAPPKSVLGAGSPPFPPPPLIRPHDGGPAAPALIGSPSPSLRAAHVILDGWSREVA